MTYAVEAQAITKTYKNGTLALQAVTFAFPPGSAIALLGPNGAGKTTTMRILATTLRPTTGTAYIEGVDVSLDPYKARQHIGLCSQEFDLDPMLTVVENLRLYGRLRGLGGVGLSRRIDELLSRFRLGELQRRRLFELSWGQMKASQVIKELIEPKSIILLDEPTSGLDAEMCRTALEAFGELVNSGCTLIVSSHRMDDVETLCSDVVFINQGVVVQKGPIRDFIEAYAHTTQVCLEVPPDTARSLVYALQDAISGVELVSEDPLQISMPATKGSYSLIFRIIANLCPEVTGVSIKQPSLRDAWLRAVGGEDSVS